MFSTSFLAQSLSLDPATTVDVLNSVSSALSTAMNSRRDETHSKDIPTSLTTLPPLLSTNPAHFITNNASITRTSVDTNHFRVARSTSILLETPFTNGTISTTITCLSLPPSIFGIGLIDSTSPLPERGKCLGFEVKNSLFLESSTGRLWFNTPATEDESRTESCHTSLNEGDCVRMEVDMESSPRTIQFFVNGETGRYFVSGLPPSVRIGVSACIPGTSFRIDRINHLKHATPLKPAMRELKWQ
ncbi:hypothetical protein BLNAU_3386 [Blattamonas nauphoetae]|uniref:B30.2/SPRY domain-containing protein n=1 Tax=Blattamonas nauphoetae TaxID=2049346 RepID=A0ABQ9YCV3_9EUKA|nr:hypothetical protein BLNAU_3386 [Blattamonas nauphoetae]